MQFRNAYIAVTLLLAITLTAFVAENTIQETTPKARKIRKEQKDKPLKICVISDLNASYGSITYPAEVSKVIQLLKTIDPDLILCSGDMVAGQKASLTEQNIRDMCASFKTTVLNPISRLSIPFGFTVGNHDASPSFTKDRTISKIFWKENVNATNLTFVDSTHYPFYYSYIKNNVFIMSWDAASAEIKPEVYVWMKAQMESNTAKKARLKILIGHLPLYAIVDSKNKPGEVNSDPAAALEFFKTYGLDLYISGHQHAYYPAKNGGIRFLNMGAIGDGPRKLIGSTAEAAKSYTIIDIPVKNARNFSYHTFTPDNVKIELSSLPDSVTGFNGISRKDVP